MPGKGYNLGGFRGTGRVRIRKGWFGRVAVEELIEYSDGTDEWVGLSLHETVEFKKEK